MAASKSRKTSSLTSASQLAGGRSVAQALLSQFKDHPWVQQVLRPLQTPKQGAGLHEVTMTQVSNLSVKALVLAATAELTQKPVVVLCPDIHAVNRLLVELPIFLGDTPLYRYPMEGDNPYELSLMPVMALKDFYRTVNALRHGEKGIYLLTPKSLLMRHLSMEERFQYALSLSVDEEFAPEAVVRHCLAMGYMEVGLVSEGGEFSRRGDIVDVYPVNGHPVRITFFGDTVETLKRLDPDTQRSVETLDTVTVLPRSELILTDIHRQQLSEKLVECLEQQRSMLGVVEFEGLTATVENQLSALGQAFWPDGIDFYAPLLHPDYRTIGSYIPAEAVVIYDDWAVFLNHLEGLSDRLQHQYEDGTVKGHLLDIGFRFHLNAVEALGTLRHITHKMVLDALPTPELGMETGGAIHALAVQAPEQFQANLPEACARFLELRRSGYQVFITSDYPQRVLDSCLEEGVPALFVSDDPEDLALKLSKNIGRDVIIAKNGPVDGFILEGLQLAHFSDSELFGRRRLKRALIEGQPKQSKDDVDTIQSLSELRTGDYVVHFKHGIGQFLEISQIKMDGEVREYLTIQYSGQDRLHVPVDQLNLLSRYRGSGEAPPKLNKMGGVEWQSVKSKVKKSIQSIAKDLIALYSARENVRGYMFEQDSPWQVEMEEAFPYTETRDQWQAIQDMKGDMESEKPMDRLICGDVGFGKTEVAIRGIFKCVLSGKQCAVLVPTTILAQQHFNTISERFKPYPVRVGLLSRFRTAKEQKEVVRRLQAGEMDVVVGTHRLLQKDVVFTDLGLLVIDEEHRFGVSHKEKIKMMRTQVDVLTLSATPIPRTLHMALSGVRDMSLIKTPPTNRSPIQTFVGPYNPAQIRVAIMYEIERGGQVYFVHNRVQTIYQKADELKQLVPEIRICIGHGQMNEHDLENVMLEFSQGQFDVLLATTIIESGVDIPNVNTMIIDRADRFGLAQLYQLRGRVGRSDTQAYAYLYYDPEKMLTEDAKNRLRAIREFTTLGSGYQIALRDMEIRGVGNILGGEQHGHMVAVGYDMYCQMLKESIDALQTGKGMVEEKEPSIIDLNVTAFIPEKWVGDRDVKLTEYKRLASIDSEIGLEIIQAEWQDRFGPIPKETIHLVNLARLRIQATLLGIPLVRVDDEGYLRIQVPYGLQEWFKIQATVPGGLGKKFRWVAPAATRSDSKPTLLYRADTLHGLEQVELLLTFFKHLLDYQNSQQKA